MLALAFTALLSSQAAPADPAVVPPPAPLAQDPSTPPPPSSAPPTPTPDKPAPKTERMNPWVVGGLQWLTGVGVAVIMTPCTCCTLGLWNCTVEPAIIGYAETFTGDALGDYRAAAIWPMVAAYAAGTIAVIIGGAILVGGGFLANGLSANNVTGALGNPVYQLAQGVAGGAGIIASLAVPITYALVEQPKKAGDDGGGWPGLLTPAEPHGPSVTTKADVKTTAMRY